MDADTLLCFFFHVCYLLQVWACPENYSKYGAGQCNTSTQKCIRIFTRLNNRNDAREICKLDGGMLATVTGITEMMYIRNNVPPYPGMFYWLDLNDIATEGQFVWSDGSAQEYEQWFPGSSSMVPEPSGDGDCAGANSYENFLWFDRPCTGNYRSLCQLMPSTEPDEPPSWNATTVTQDQTTTTLPPLTSLDTSDLTSSASVADITSPITIETQTPPMSAVLSASAVSLTTTSVTIDMLTISTDARTSSQTMNDRSTSTNEPTSGAVTATHSAGLSSTTDLKSMLYISTDAKASSRSKSSGFMNERTSAIVTTTDSSGIRETATLNLEVSKQPATSRLISISGMRLQTTIFGQHRGTPTKASTPSWGTEKNWLPSGESTLTQVPGFNVRIEKFTPKIHEATGASAMGILGIAIISTLLGCIILSDLPLIRGHIRYMLDNVGLNNQLEQVL